MIRPENSESPVEVSIADLINNNELKVPMIKLLNDQCYLFGTEVLQPFMHGNTCVVRIGGGFEPIEQYVVRCQDQQRRIILKAMVKEQIGYEQILEGMLTKYIRNKNKVFVVMQNMKWYFAKQGYLYYGQAMPEMTPVTAEDVVDTDMFR